MKNVIITGASRGIGYAIAEAFKHNGWNVIGTATHKNSTNENIHVDQWIYADFTVDSHLDLLCQEIGDLSYLDACVNNAGINIIKKQNLVSKDDFSMMNKINLESPYFISAIAAQKMSELNGGKIVNLSSIWSVVTKEHRSLYSTFKTGLLGLTRAMAIEWAKQNILINAISPGFVNTELTQKSLSAEQQEDMAKKVPLGRFADPSEIAKAVLFLCSEKNTYITGQNIVIDGGFTIR